jgi:hypothetical protein
MINFVTIAISKLGWGLIIYHKESEKVVGANPAFRKILILLYSWQQYNWFDLFGARGFDERKVEGNGCVCLDSTH